MSQGITLGGSKAARTSSDAEGEKGRSPRDLRRGNGGQTSIEGLSSREESEGRENRSAVTAGAGAALEETGLADALGRALGHLAKGALLSGSDLLERHLVLADLVVDLDRVAVGERATQHFV